MASSYALSFGKRCILKYAAWEHGFWVFTAHTVFHMQFGVCRIFKQAILFLKDSKVQPIKNKHLFYFSFDWLLQRNLLLIFYIMKGNTSEIFPTLLSPTSLKSTAFSRLQSTSQLESLIDNYALDLISICSTQCVHFSFSSKEGFLCKTTARACLKWWLGLGHTALPPNIPT